MDMKQYEKYLVYNEPIPYLPLSIVKKYEDIKSEILTLSKKIHLSKEESEHLNILQEEINNPLHLLIHPIKMNNYLDFHMAIHCLTINKNQIPDPKVISMSYLDFLFYTLNNNENGQIYLIMLLEIFRMCLNVNYKQIEYIEDEKGKINFIFILDCDGENKKVKIDKTDFDNIKNIILYQNIPDYDDAYIDPKMEKALKEAQEFMNKNKKKMASLEDQIICVMLALNETDESKIHNLTIRKFAKILQRYDYKLHYEIYKQAECSGMVTFKQEIDHWMSDLSVKDKYADVKVDFEEFKNKVNGKKS